jgi:hypothetical protein
MCPPRDAVSSTLAHLDPWLIHPALPGAADSAVDNKTHPAHRGQLKEPAMPFEVKEGEPLTERIGVRVTAAEKAKLRADADDAGLSVSELVRRRYFGRKIVAHADEKMIRHLNRIGGLLKHVHVESGGVYSAETARALRQVYSFIDQLANREDAP